MEYKFYNREVELNELLDAFKKKVINNKSILGYIIHGRSKIGKSRLVSEFIKKLEYDIELHSDIPKFEIEKHVIQYVCEKDNIAPYLPFVRITNEIKNRNKLINILLKIGQLALAIVGINDVLEALYRLFYPIDKGKDEKIIIKKETSTFNKYRRFIKMMGHGTPLIIYIQNGQWLDIESLELIRKLAYDNDPMKGMIIIETDDDEINEASQNKINQLVFDGIFQRIHLNPLDKNFPCRLLSSRFGEDFFTKEENEVLYTISAGCPGILVDHIDSYISKRWIFNTTVNGREEWKKTAEFKEKIKPPSQKLVDLIVSFYEDKDLSKSEMVTIKKMSALWNLSEEYVSGIISMIMDIMDAGYIIIKDLDTGIISKNCFVITDGNNNRFIAEYLHNTKYINPTHLQSRDIHNNHLLEAKEIKVCKSGVMILWDYFEGKVARQGMIEAFEKHTLESIKKMKEISLGLVELHTNNIVHGFIKPESIIQNQDGKFQLATFDISLFSSINFDESGYLEDDHDQPAPDEYSNDWETLHYLSPEQLQGQNPNFQSDIFSLGVVFYKTLTNRFPYHGRVKSDLLQSINNDEVPFGGYLLSTVSDELKSIILKCINPDYHNRYANASEFISALNKVEIITPPVRPALPVVKNTKWRKYLMYVLLTIAALAISGYFIFGDGGGNSGGGAETHIKDCITVSVQNKNNKSDPKKQINPELIEYLILHDLMQSSNEMVLSERGFNRIFTENEDNKFLSKKEVHAEIVTNGYGFDNVINITIIRNFKTGSPEEREFKVDFTTPSELLRGDINELTKSILETNTLKTSTFTKDWDSFLAFYNGEKAWERLNSNLAMHEYQKAIAIDPNFVLAKLRLADVYHFSGNNTAAILKIKEILPYLSQLSKADSIRAIALKNKMAGDIVAAKRNYQDLIKLLPARKEPYYDLAEAYFELRDIVHAKENYKRALGIDSTFTQALNHYAYCFSHLGDHHKAMYYFSKYLRLDSSANAFDSYGDGLMAAGLLDSAEWAKKQGLKLDPDLDYLYNGLNYIQVRKGEYNAAINSVNKYLSLQNSPELLAEGYTNKALIYFASGDYKMSLDTCLLGQEIFDTLDLVARNHKMHWLLGQLYIKLGDIEHANQEIAQMETINNRYHINQFNYNENYKYYLHLKSLIAAKNGEIDQLDDIVAIFNGEIHDKIKDWSSPFDLAYFNTEFGRMYLQLGENSKAENCFREALLYNPNYALAHYYYAKLYAKIGDENKEKIHKDKFVKLWSGADEKAKNQYHF